MKKSILLLFLAVTFLVNAQSPYKFRWSVDVPIISIGLATNLGGIIHEKKRDDITPETILALNRMDVNTFDRSATYNWNPKVAKLSDATMYVAMATPLLFLAGKETRKDFGTVAAISAEVFVLNTGITYLTKELVQRKRPYLYNPNAPWDKKIEKGATQSFFSGHTSTVASMSYSFAMMYTHYYPNSRFKPLVWFAAAVLPFGTAIMRVRAGKHYWTDVMVGYGAGAAIGVGVPLLHRIKRN